MIRVKLWNWEHVQKHTPVITSNAKVNKMAMKNAMNMILHMQYIKFHLGWLKKKCQKILQRSAPGFTLSPWNIINCTQNGTHIYIYILQISPVLYKLPSLLQSYKTKKGVHGKQMQRCKRTLGMQSSLTILILCTHTSHFSFLFLRGGGVGVGGWGGGLVATVNERTAWILFISMFIGLFFQGRLCCSSRQTFTKKKNEKKRKQTCIYIYSLCIGSTRMFSKMPKLYWVFRGNDVKGKKEKRGGAMMENI